MLEAEQFYTCHTPVCHTGLQNF